jgi:hypothetical protein
MDHTSELRSSLNGHFSWNKARITCFVQMLLSLFTTRTVNLNKLACHITGSEAGQLSRYRRLQRFFAEFGINFDLVAGFMFKLFFRNGRGQWYLTIDRTNWTWGKTELNILTLGIAYQGTAIPIYWDLLDNKGGNSSTYERICLIRKFIKQFGKENIAGLLGDREFVGKDWFGWLISEKIPFYIRLKKSTVTTNAHGSPAWMDALFNGLKPGEQRALEGKRNIWGCMLYLSGLRLADWELLIVATDQPPEDAIRIYGLRWEIETLFGCLKGRGFNFEDTHITHLDRIKKMVVLLSVAFAWAHKVGEWRNEAKPIVIKKHGRPAVSIFRVGMDYLAEAIMNVFLKPILIRDCLKIFKKSPKTRLSEGMA